MTYFFRDLDTLELAVRNLLAFTKGRSRVRVWDAGCAMGQEPYTLAILLAERMSPATFRNLEIHATDHDASLLESVRAAVYLKAEMERIPPDLFARYTEPVAGSADHHRLSDAIRSVLRVAHHDLLSLKPVRTDFHMVVCKNVLLHFHHDQRVEVIKMFHHAREPGGLLVMEHTQKLPLELGTWFQQVGGVDQVYRKIEVPPH